MKFFRLAFTLRSSLTRAFAFARDPRVPMRLKVMAVAAALLILSPLNILGDIPFLGIVDDAALLMLLLNWFVRASEPHTVQNASPQTAGTSARGTGLIAS